MWKSEINTTGAVAFVTFFGGEEDEEEGEDAASDFFGGEEGDDDDEEELAESFLAGVLLFFGGEDATGSFAFGSTTAFSTTSVDFPPSFNLALHSNNFFL